MNLYYKKNFNFDELLNRAKQGKGLSERNCVIQENEIEQFLRASNFESLYRDYYQVRDVLNQLIKFSKTLSEKNEMKFF